MNAIAQPDPLSPLTTRHPAALARLGRLPAQRDTGPAFRVLESVGRPPGNEDPRSDQQAATLLVSQLFVGPLLAKAREFPIGGEIGHGGRGEDVFGEQLDQVLADRIAARLPGLTSQLRSRFAAQRQASDTAHERLEQLKLQQQPSHAAWNTQILRDIPGRSFEESA